MRGVCIVHVVSSSAFDFGAAKVVVLRSSLLPISAISNVRTDILEAQLSTGSLYYFTCRSLKTWERPRLPGRKMLYVVL